ncbi:hypothetical protein EC991_009873 [Linnemannia zychae]|nr:hypothetical protein EC991_009873 [Linnemannia zychae]
MESNGVRSDAMPRMLECPRNVVQITAGRQVVLAIDASGQLWQWCRENKAVEVTFASSPSLHHRPSLQQQACSALPTTTPPGVPTTASLGEGKIHDPIEQITAGWDICAALTRSGKIYAWRPPLTADGRYQYRIHLEHSVQLKEQGYDGYEASASSGDKFVAIAAGTDYVVAVTSLEKVYVFRRVDSPNYNHAEAIMSTSGAKGTSQQQQHYRNSRHHHQNSNHLNVFTDANGRMQDQMEFEDRIVIEPEVEGYKQERVVEIKGRVLGAGLQHRKLVLS